MTWLNYRWLSPPNSDTTHSAVDERSPRMESEYTETTPEQPEQEPTAEPTAEPAPEEEEEESASA